ncbi:RNA polymerase sigma factor [Lysinibacillus sp. 54212]|uniref:RNA polymerase sigma factor n=1 Tax=Lysinibacillus sp. 54212 TaxID=3119829 RepID=UPI002FC8BCAE
MNIEELIYTYSDYLYRVAFIYTKDERAAEEVVQDVFFNFYRKRDQYNGTASLKTYLTKMTINRSYDYLRSWKRAKWVFSERFKESTEGTEAKYIRCEERGEITRAVLTLPVKYREVLLLYYYEDFSVKEIAVFLNSPESTIKTRLQRAREKLKQVLPRQKWEVLANDDAR